MADPTAVVAGVEVVGLAAAVPAMTRGPEDLARIFGDAEASRIIKSTGIHTRHIAPDGMCTSDLCHAAADRLLNDLNWARSDVDVLIFVSQTPDYVLPATSCVLHHRLGLSTRCAAFDMNLGCSGYVYGLWVASRLLHSGARRALLLVGDTISKLSAPEDRSVAPLFGDAGTATALEWIGGESRPWYFELGTDGAGAMQLCVPAGGFRNRWSAPAAERQRGDDGNSRSDTDLFMNGAEIFAFTIREVPPLISRTLLAAGCGVDDVDGVVLHQANKLMLEHIARRSGIPSGKLALCLQEYGNTSSASIPMAIIHSFRTQCAESRQRLLLAGFGVGFSWAAVCLETQPMCIPSILEL